MKTYLKQNYNKFLLLALSVIIISLALSFSFDMEAKKLIDDSLKQAVIVFGSAKALNAVISFAQGTQLELPFVTLAIGEVLDPINDLVEQFSLVMLASITSLGIQKILMGFVSHNIYNYILISFIVVFNIWLFFRFAKDEKIRTLFFQITFVLLFLRFAIPFVGYLNDLSYNYFVKPQYNIEKLNSSIVKVKDEVNKVTKQTIEQKQDSSFFNKIKEKFDTSYYEKRVDEYRSAVDNSSEYIIDLIIVFIFQTIFLPILFLLMFYFFIKSIVNVGKA